MGEEVALYGTVAKMKLKPGAEEKMMQAMQGSEPGRVGHVATYVFKSDADPNVHFVTTIFESKSAYQAFADSPEQDKRFRQLRELLDADPEWHDGEVIHHDTKVEASRR
jgi:heme-degrading monooxygenase HmoA